MARKKKKSQQAANRHRNRGAEAAAPSKNAPTSNDTPTRSWIEALHRVVQMTAGEQSATVKTSVACHAKDDRRTLFLPPEMPALQPRSLRYLGAFGMRNNFQLIEDRRQIKVSPVVEQRNGRPPAVTLGLALLMKQAGLKGPVVTPSQPHRLEADNPLIDLPELIGMAAHAAPSAKRIVTLPNRPLVDVLNNDTQPITGYGCLMETNKTRTLLTHFEGEALRCIGYSTGSQYVMHLLLAGGPLTSPTLWTHPSTLTRTDIRFRLFHGHKHAHDFGVLYSTFYFDMEKHNPRPWWLDGFAGRAQADATQLAAS